LANVGRPLAAVEQLSASNEDALITTQEVSQQTGVADIFHQRSDTCSEFGKNITKWTKHSNTTKLSLGSTFNWNME
jgi:hypothetical protein